MRQWFAKKLVRWAARWLEASYNAYVRVDRDGFPKWWESLWTKPCNWVNAIAIPAAHWLSPEATGEQMVEEGWWG